MEKNFDIKLEIQYTAFYSALLRGVNPYNQLGVEKSKENIFGIVKGIGR